MDIIFSVIIIMIIILAVVNTVYSYRYKVVNMPSSRATRQAIAQDIIGQYGVNYNGTICELGGGWGGLAVKLTKQFPLATVHSFEISPFPHLVSKMRKFFLGTNQYELRRTDFFKSDFSNVDILICYLSPYHMDRIANEIMPTLKKRAIIYSQGFKIESVDGGETLLSRNSGIENNLYKYQRD
jgi:hypothetical protein